MSNAEVTAHQLTAAGGQQPGQGPQGCAGLQKHLPELGRNRALAI